MNNHLNLKKVKNHLDRLWKIIVDLNISITNAKSLFEYQEKGSSSVKFGFMSHHFYQLKFIMIIQLMKFLDKKEKSSLLKLLNKLENLKYDSDLKEHLNSNGERGNDSFSSKLEIKEFRKIYIDDLASHSDNINKVKILRNKLYAHQDEDYVIGIDFKGLEDLIELCSKWYKDFARKLLNSNHMIEKVDDWDVKYVLNQLEIAKRLEMEKFKIDSGQIPPGKT